MSIKRAYDEFKGGCHDEKKPDDQDDRGNEGRNVRRRLNPPAPRYWVLQISLVTSILFDNGVRSLHCPQLSPYLTSLHDNAHNQSYQYTEVFFTNNMGSFEEFIGRRVVFFQWLLNIRVSLLDCNDSAAALFVRCDGPVLDRVEFMRNEGEEDKPMYEYKL